MFSFLEFFEALDVVARSLKFQINLAFGVQFVDLSDPLVMRSLLVHLKS